MNTGKTILTLAKAFYETKVVLLPISSIIKNKSENKDYEFSCGEVINIFNNGDLLMANVRIVDKVIAWPVKHLHAGSEYVEGSEVNLLSKHTWMLVFDYATPEEWKPLFHNNECVGIAGGLKCKFCNARGNLPNCEQISDEDKKLFRFRRVGKGLYRYEVIKVEPTTHKPGNECYGLYYDASNRNCIGCGCRKECIHAMGPAVANNTEKVSCFGNFKAISYCDGCELKRKCLNKTCIEKCNKKYKTVEKRRAVGPSCPTKEESEEFRKNQTPEERFNMRMSVLHLAKRKRLNEKVIGKYTHNLRDEKVKTKECKICGIFLPEKAEYCCNCGKDQTKQVCRIPNCDGIIYTSYRAGKLIPVCTQCGVTQVIGE